MNKEVLTSPILEALLQIPHLSVTAVDPQGRVIVWNQSASRLFGWNESEVVGRPLPIIPQDQRQQFMERIENGRRGDTVNALEVRRLRKDGTLIDVDLWTSPLRNNTGEVIGILGLHIDISASRQADGALRKAEAELHRVLSAVSDCVYSGEFDSDGGFFYHYYSPAAERILGRPPLFFLAGPEQWLKTVHREDRPRLEQAFARLQTGQSTSAEEEYRIVHPDGTIHWVRDSVVLSEENGHRFVNGVISDISSRKKMEQALQASEMELRRVLDGASDYFWSGEIDSEGGFRYRYYSPAVERITGRPAEFYMPGSERWMSTVHPEDRARLTEISERLRSGQLVSNDYEYRIILPDGTIRWVLAKTNVSPPREGRRRVDGVVSDITAHKQAEEALRASEARFRRIFTDAGSGIVLVSPEGRFLQANPAFCEFVGYTEQELINKRVQDVTHPEDRLQSEKFRNSVWEGGKSQIRSYEKRYLRKDGRAVWGAVSMSLVHDVVGQAKYSIAQVLDITERKLTEVALQESEERYRLMVEAIPQLAWRTDPQGEVTECNGRWYQYTGQSPEEARGFGWKKALHRDDVNRAIQKVQVGLASGELFQVEYRLRRASDSSYRWHLARTVPIKGKDGQIVSWFGTATDIDDQRRVQENLEGRVQERTVELAKANDALRESETKYRTLVEEIPAITYTTAWDETYTTLYVSPQIEAVLGFTPAEVTATPDFWPQHMHPDDYQRIITEAERAFACGKSFDGEYRVLNRKGEIVWVRDRAAVIRDEAGKPLFLQGVLLDVTERRRTEETTRLQSAALESAANGIVITDRDGQIIWANPAFAKLTGYELSEVLGKNPRVLSSGKHSKSFYRNLWRTVLSGRVWHGEIVNKRRNGSLYTEEMTITPVQDTAGQSSHFIAIKQDITEWKLAEESQRHLAAIVESSGDAIFAGDVNGIIRSWNAGAEQLYDYTADEIVGRSVSVLVPRDRKAELREIIKKLNHGEHFQHYETVRLKKGGIPVDVSITVSPIKNEAGQVVGISAITRDISTRKELERAVVEAASREQNRIGQDLHDGLCQQLTGISFLWKAIIQREEVRALLAAGTVKEISQLITKTIGEARDLARVLCPVELESDDLGVALKNLGLSMERLSAVSFVVRCQRPVLLADKTVATHLYRIAQEAISNAVRHGKAARIWIHLTWKKDKLTLRIKDNGSGFSKRRGLKEGIGMRSMKYRAHAIGGSISIESQRGTGTTVVCVYTQPHSRIAGEARRRTPL